MSLKDLTQADFTFYKQYASEMRSCHEKEFLRMAEPDLMRMLYRGFKLKHNQEMDAYYYDKASGDNFYSDKDNFLTLSRMFQGANTILPNLMYQMPRAIAIPKHGATPQSAAIMASALNHYIVLNESKRENQEAVMNAWFFGLGWKKIGYKTVFFPRDPVAQEPESMLDKFGQAVDNMTGNMMGNMLGNMMGNMTGNMMGTASGLKPDNLESRERPDVVDYETLFNTSESPLNIMLDHKADLRNSKTILHHMKRTLYELENFGDYDPVALNEIYEKFKSQKGTRLSSREVDLDLNELHIQQRNGVWILTWVDQYEKALRYDKSTYQGKGFQFEPLSFTNEPGVRYPVSHMKVASQAQIKIDDMATLFLDIVSRSRNQVIINEKMLSPGQKRSVELNKTGGIIWTSKPITGTDYAQLTNPSVSNDIPNLMLMCQQNMVEIMGTDPQMISGTSSNKTLGQDELARVGTKVRESGMVDKVRDFLINQLRKEGILLKEYSKAQLHLIISKKDYYNPMTGLPITDEWMSFMTPESPISLKEKLQGEYDYEINMYEAIKPDKKALQQEYIEALKLFSMPDLQAALLQSGVRVRIDKLAEGLAKQFEFLKSEEFLEELDSRQQAAIQVQQILMQNKGQLPQNNITPIPKGNAASASVPSRNSDVTQPSSQAQSIQ